MLYCLISGGHKEFHRRHKELCENTLLPAPSDAAALTASAVCCGGGGGVGDSNHMQRSVGLLAAEDVASSKDDRHQSDIDSHPASRVLPYLYLGNAKDAADLSLLQRLGITRVLNVTSQIPGYHEQSGITYKQLPANDSGHQNLKQYFEQAFEFIGELALCIYSSITLITLEYFILRCLRIFVLRAQYSTPFSRP